MSESQNMREYTGGQPQSRDRRLHVRRIPESLTYVEWGAGNGAIVGNISENGLSITAAEMLVSEFFPRIRFQLPKSERFIEAGAQIVWLSPSSKGAGIEFVDLPEDARDQLRKWISSGGSPSEFPERRRQPRGNEMPFPAMPSPRNVGPLAVEPTNNSGLRDSDLEKLFPSEFAPAPSRELERDSAAPQLESPGVTRNAIAPTASAHESFFPSTEVRRDSVCDSALDSGAYVSPLGPSRDTVAPPAPPGDSAHAAASLLAASVAPINSAGLSAGAIPGEPGDFTPPRISRPEQLRESAPSLPSRTRHQMDDSILKLRRQIASEWIEPAPARRNGAVIAVVGILLAALVFSAGLTVGKGYLEKWLGHGDAAKQVANPSSDNSSHSSTNSPVNTANSPDNSPGASPAHAQTSTGETQAAPNAGENSLPGNAGASHGPRASKPRSATASAPVDESLGPLLVTPPVEGSSPFRLTLPEKAVSASHSLAISSQRSVLVPPEPGAASFHHAERLQIGGLIFHVEPQYPRGSNQIEIEEIVKLRAIVGENGRITDVKRISGPMPLIPAAMSAIREWRYAPTLLNGRPVQTEENVTIVFRSR